MQRRILTMIILWTIIGSVIWFAGLMAGKLLLVLFALGSAWEVATLLRKTGFPLTRWTLVAGIGIILLGAIFGYPTAAIGTAFALILLTHLAKKPLTLLWAVALLILLSAGFGSLLALLRLPLPHPILTVLWVIATIKLSDANAYLIGSRFGKHRIAPSISPQKSYEGLSGVLIAGVLMGIFGAPLFPGAHKPVLFAIISGVIITAFGAIGDFAESALKRMAAVKDSGNLLPGIGGILDLTDSLIFGTPIAYLLIRLWGI